MLLISFRVEHFSKFVCEFFPVWFLCLLVELKTTFMMRHKARFGLELCFYVSNFDLVVYLLVQVLYFKLS